MGEPLDESIGSKIGQSVAQKKGKFKKLKVSYSCKQFKLPAEEPGVTEWIKSFFAAGPSQEEMLQQLAKVEALPVTKDRLPNENFV